MVDFHKINFEHRIEVHQTWFGKWTYVIHLDECCSRKSRKFPTREEAVADAERLLQLMS